MDNFRNQINNLGPYAYGIIHATCILTNVIHFSIHFYCLITIFICQSLYFSEYFPFHHP